MFVSTNLLITSFSLNWSTEENVVYTSKLHYIIIQVMHQPFPLQLGPGHMSVEQSFPSKPELHAHTLLLSTRRHVPCPVQSGSPVFNQTTYTALMLLPYAHAKHVFIHHFDISFIQYMINIYPYSPCYICHG